MSQYPQQYYGYYYPAGYVYYPAQWQTIFPILIGIPIVIAMVAWAFSIARKAVRGEEVEYPL